MFRPYRAGDRRGRGPRALPWAGLLAGLWPSAPRHLGVQTKTSEIAVDRGRGEAFRVGVVLNISCMNVFPPPPLPHRARACRDAGDVGARRDGMGAQGGGKMGCRGDAMADAEWKMAKAGGAMAGVGGAMAGTAGKTGRGGGKMAHGGSGCAILRAGCAVAGTGFAILCAGFLIT